ncbi:MAG: hypothetical protein QGG40_08135 [Myxococcota bacterium]|nr:hypothetical protein [Myxococcota bacterium]
MLGVLQQVLGPPAFRESNFVGWVLPGNQQSDSCAATSRWQTYPNRREVYAGACRNTSGLAAILTVDDE